MRQIKRKRKKSMASQPGSTVGAAVLGETPVGAGVGEIVGLVVGETVGGIVVSDEDSGSRQFATHSSTESGE